MAQKRMPPENDPAHLAQHLNSLMKLYEHHLDLFWKWITLYVTVVTGISAYIFNKDILPSTKRLLPLLIAVASFGIAFGCLIMWSWLKELQNDVSRLSSESDAFQYPSFLGIKMTKAALVATVLCGMFNVLYTIYGNF